MKKLLLSFLKGRNKQTTKQTNKLIFKFLLFSLSCVPFFSNAQIKVDASGHIGLFSSTIPANCDVYLNGRIKLYTSSNLTFTSGYGDYLYIANNTNTAEIYPYNTNTGKVGTSTKRFQYIYGYYLYYNGGFLGSDKRLKENFRKIESPLSKIVKMDGWEYDFIHDETDTIGNEKEKENREKLKKDRIGFIAQEMIDILPEVVNYNEESDQYFIEYTAIIPVIVEAMKEQQTKIETLEKEIEKLNAKTNEKSVTFGQSDEAPATLNQNIPNPFSSNTRIEMFVPNAVSRANLYIYNMQGEQIKQLTITERGNSSVTIEGHSLKAGMYLYTLIADGKEVDTKKMILTK